jgi:hypothetical protein
MVPTKQLSDPIVRAFVAAVNAHDKEAFTALMTPGATMTDDGSERDLEAWTDREIFTTRGHMDVIAESEGGRALIADYRNDTWGTMRTTWRFTIENDKIAHFDTAQA